MRKLLLIWPVVYVRSVHTVCAIRVLYGDSDSCIWGHLGTLRTCLERSLPSLPHPLHSLPPSPPLPSPPPPFHSQDVPSPLGYLVSHWRSDPFARMSYSYAAVGSSGEDYRTMAEDCYQKLYFAGEVRGVVISVVLLRGHLPFCWHMQINHE